MDVCFPLALVGKQDEDASDAEFFHGPSLRHCKIAGIKSSKFFPGEKENMQELETASLYHEQEQAMVFFTPMKEEEEKMSMMGSSVKNEEKCIWTQRL